MKIKTNEGDMNVTGYGQGIYNSVGASLGIASFLGMGANNGGCCNNGGLLGGLFGGNNHNGCCGCPVDQKELHYAIELASCRGREYALETARAEDAKIFAEARRSDDKIAGVVKEVTDGLIKVGVAVAENSKELECLKVEVKRNREEARSYTDAAVAHESQIRTLSDTNLKAYVDNALCHKIDGVLRIDGSQICYNPCPCGKETDPFYVAQAKPAK